MSLVRVAIPESESHLALIVCALEAADIPHFVHGAGIGSLLPGLQIASYNSRAVMVPASCVPRALDILAELPHAQSGPDPDPTVRDKWRMVLEALFMGWLVPGPKGKGNAGT